MQKHLKEKGNSVSFLRGRLQMRNLRAQPGKLQNLVDGPFFMSEISQLDTLEAFSSVLARGARQACL